MSGPRPPTTGLIPRPSLFRQHSRSGTIRATPLSGHASLIGHIPTEGLGIAGIDQSAISGGRVRHAQSSELHPAGSDFRSVEFRCDLECPRPERNAARAEVNLLTVARDCLKTALMFAFRISGLLCYFNNEVRGWKPKRTTAIFIPASPLGSVTPQRVMNGATESLGGFDKKPLLAQGAILLKLATVQ